MTVGHLLNTTGAVERVTTTPDGAGGYAEAWATVDDALRCRPSQPSVTEHVVADQVEVVVTVPVYCSPGADVRRGDRLHLPGYEPLEVVDVVMPSRPIYKRADCRGAQDAV